jgi:hypothetical protein
VKMLCPGCAHRIAHIIALDCPVCAGAGLLQLHPAALEIYDSESVAQAVTIALEAIARNIDESTILIDARADLLADQVSELAAARLIYFADDPDRGIEFELAALQDPVYEPETADPLELITGFSPAPMDAVLAAAEPFEYAAEDRPMMRGLPVTSEAGHPSSLARICDPVDQLEKTSDKALRVKRRVREANVLVKSAKVAARRRRKGAVKS